MVEHLHAYHAHAGVQQAQEEEAEQQAVPVNELANQDTKGQEVGEQQESFNHQDSAYHTYCTQADVQYVGCIAGMWEVNQTCQLQKKGGGERRKREEKASPEAKLRPKAERAETQ